MAREMYLAGVSEEELQPTPKAQPPQTPKGKWENYWYHYKWATIGGVFAVVVVVFLIVQAATINRPDYQMLLVTEKAYLEQQLEPLEQALAKYGQDVDGDGEVEVQIINAYMGKKNSTEYYTNSQVLQAHLISGDLMLYVWEPAYYESFMEMISQSADEGYRFLASLPAADGMLDDNTAWNWADSARHKEVDSIGVLPENLYFGVRNAKGTAEKSAQMYEQGLALLTGFITGEKPTAK